MDTKESDKETSNKAALKFLGLFVGALFLIGAAGAVWIFGGGDDEGDRAAEARAVCEQWVADQLRAPSTASFTIEQIDGEYPSYAIAGLVDAENAFGGTVRERWGCGIRHHEGEWVGNASINSD